MWNLTSHKNHGNTFLYINNQQFAYLHLIATFDNVMFTHKIM